MRCDTLKLVKSIEALTNSDVSVRVLLNHSREISDVQECSFDIPSRIVKLRNAREFVYVSMDEIVGFGVTAPVFSKIDEFDKSMK